ncbi:hypothetical protein V6N11_075231 [Hibiscus sabdariffa]|uniref:Uncharacterized protein n=1 Tax=Hibiscus sabdariffa TaxID=183260 RepID=A0ABR2R6D0_9ROSI
MRLYDTELDFSLNHFFNVKYSKDPGNSTKSFKVRGNDLKVHFKALLNFRKITRALFLGEPLDFVGS